MVTYHGRTDIKHIATVRCLWYGSFHARAVTVVLVRDEATTSGYDLALVTTDGTAAADPARIVSRYAMRWSVEQAFADARNVLGAGEARNRTRLAVDRTVPFALLAHTLIVVWYARHGYDQADIDARRDDQPWYGEKTSRPSRTCSSSSAASSSPPDFPPPPQASPPPAKSAPSPQPGPQRRPDPENLRKSSSFRRRNKPRTRTPATGNHLRRGHDMDATTTSPPRPSLARSPPAAR